MNFTGVGDLAQNLMLRRQGADLKAQMARLTAELTTGESKDVSERVRGDFGALAGIEQHLGQLSAFQRVRDDLSVQIGVVQSSLAGIQDSVDGYGARLVSSATLNQPDHLKAVTAEAHGKLEQVVSYLNTHQGGRYLFSGTATDQRPLVSAEVIVSELETVVAGASDAADFVTRIDSWFFDSGGGFETLAYGGATETLEQIRISERSRIDQPIAADDVMFRGILRGLAVTSIVASGLAPSSADSAVLAKSAGESLVGGAGGVVVHQSVVGQIEGLLAREDTTSLAEQSAMSAAKSRIVSVDPYEAAAELEAVQFQMETLYVLTARMSQLRLSDYLR